MRKPAPYCTKRNALATFDGLGGAWISISGEWVKLTSDEVLRLMKKHKQAKQLRLQWEAESGLKAE